MGRAADWDAATYQRVAAPHAVWGASVLDRLQLDGDETVLDAGCGSGRVTAQLLQRLTRGGRVIAADRSPAMLAEARRTLEPYGERVTYLETDLLEIDQALRKTQGANTAAPTARGASVDVVFSTATFHWIEDHDRLFGALHRVLKPQGRLVVQFGGGDNLASFTQAADTVARTQPYAANLEGKRLWRYFYGPDETVARLHNAGFTHADAWLEPSPQTFKDHPALAEFVKTVVLSAHIAALPEALQQPFVDSVVEETHRRHGAYVLDYVRLNVDAIA